VKLQEVINKLGLVSMNQAIQMLKFRGELSFKTAVKRGVIDSARVGDQRKSPILVRLAEVMIWDEGILTGKLNLGDPGVHRRLRQVLPTLDLDTFGMNRGDREIICRLYGLEGYKESTLPEVAVLMERSEVRIRERRRRGLKLILRSEIIKDREKERIAHANEKARLRLMVDYPTGSAANSLGPVGQRGPEAGSSGD
jgi:hypothetical protein